MGDRFEALPSYAGGPPLIRRYRIPPAEIAYLSALVEGYDGIGQLRTVDPERGIIECWMMRDFEADFEALIASVRQEFPVEPWGAGAA